MTEKDIMVGDWFRFRYTTISNREVVHTFRISQVENQLGQYYVWGDGFGRMCHPENLEPIPLTPEILEKNVDGGYFNYQSEPQKRSIYHIDKVSLYVEWERIVPSPYIEIHGLGDTFFKGYISSVHELQHCLKLVDIKIEIVL